MTLLQWGNTFPQKVLSIIALLLESYKKQIVTLCCEEKFDPTLTSLREEHAKAAFSAFHKEWKKLHMEECVDYIAYKKTYPQLKSRVHTQGNDSETIQHTAHKAKSE